MISLRRLGANEFADILGGALALWESKERENPGSVEEYVEEALLLEFEEYDNRFGDAQPPLVEILERHLDENQELFVVIRGG